MSFEPLADPFGLRADPDRYVPRPATEQALDALERGVLLSDSPVVLFGPPGIGKTLLLRVLGQRLASSFRSAYLPYPLLTPREICRWALMELEEVHLGNPEASLVEAARRGEGRDLGVLLLIDDADALPLRTAERLFEMFHQCQGDLRIVMAAADQERAERIFAQHAEQLEVVRLAAPMNRAETATWLRGHLSGLDDTARARFDETAIDALHATSQGLPGPLQSAATEVLRGTPLPEARDTLHALAEIEAELAATQGAQRTPGTAMAAAPPPALQTEDAPQPDASLESEPEPRVVEAAPLASAPIAASEPGAEVPAHRGHATAPEPEPAQVAEPLAERPAEPAPVAVEPASITAAVAAPAATEPEPAETPWVPSAEELPETHAEPGSGSVPAPRARGGGRRRRAKHARPAARTRRGDGLGVRKVATAAVIAAVFAGAFALTLSWPFGDDAPAATEKPARNRVDVAAPPPARGKRTPVEEKLSPPPAPAEATRPMAAPDAPARSAPVAPDADRSEDARVAAAPSAEATRSATVPSSERRTADPSTEASRNEAPRNEAPEGATPEPAPAVAASQPNTPTPERPAVAAAPPTPTPTAPPAPVVAPPPEPRARPAPAPRALIPVAFEAPEGARIEVDGRSVGEAPLEDIPVRAGRHRIVARLADGSVMQRTVEISPERDRVVFY